MAISISTLKSWFTTGKFPTQAQFWAWLDSFRHKDESIPVAEINGLNPLLDLKADAEALQNHLANENAHAGLFAKSRFIPYGELLVFEPEGKTTPGVLTEGDYCQGYVEGEFINANYLGGDKTLLASYDI